MEKLDKFERAVKNEANRRVQERIRNFRGAISKAIEDFHPGTSTYFISQGQEIPGDYPARNYLMCILSGTPHTGWPKKLWDIEEETVSQELISLLDPLQRALKAPEPGPDDCSPGIIEPQAHNQ